jgi:hypothetical protein
MKVQTAPNHGAGLLLRLSRLVPTGGKARSDANDYTVFD